MTGCKGGERAVGYKQMAVLHWAGPGVSRRCIVQRVKQMVTRVALLVAPVAFLPHRSRSLQERLI